MIGMRREFFADDSNLLVSRLSQREIPSLYGLRGVAAIVVVIYHYCLEWKLGNFPGYYSVTLFFELSGLLITWLLLKEIDQTGAIDKKQFYIRRSLRLFPVFYVVWIICRLNGPFPGSWFYFFYLGDYFTAVTGKYSVLTSAWSLGVEEKFYLIWPQFIGRISLPTLTRILLGVLILDPFYRLILTLSGHEYYTEFAFEARLGPIVLGCLIAIMAKRGWSPPRWMLHPITLILSAIVCVPLWRSPETVTFVLAIMLIYVICKPPYWLNNPVIRFFGLISYSMYLCHEYVAYTLWPWLMQQSRPQAQLSPYLGLTLQLLLAIFVGTALHYAVERPFLKLKDRFHRKPQRPPASA